MNKSNDDSIQNDSTQSELIGESHRDYYILSLPNSHAHKFDSFKELKQFVDTYYDAD